MLGASQAGDNRGQLLEAATAASRNGIASVPPARQAQRSRLGRSNGSPAAARKVDRLGLDRPPRRPQRRELLDVELGEEASLADQLNCVALRNPIQDLEELQLVEQVVLEPEDDRALLGQGRQEADIPVMEDLAIAASRPRPRGEKPSRDVPQLRIAEGRPVS